MDKKYLKYCKVKPNDKIKRLENCIDANGHFLHIVTKEYFKMLNRFGKTDKYLMGKKYFKTVKV